MVNYFFEDWQVLLRTLVVGVLAYITLIVLLRISGKRTLSKMNAFDFVVTIALGSTLAAILLNEDISIVRGALAFILLIGMQYIVNYTSVRIQSLHHAITGDPSLLFYQGEFLEDVLRKERLTKEEVRTAVRSSGFATLEAVEAVVLETDGSFSVIQRGEADGDSSLTGIAPAMIPGAKE